MATIGFTGFHARSSQMPAGHHLDAPDLVPAAGLVATVMVAAAAVAAAAAEATYVMDAFPEDRPEPSAVSPAALDKESAKHMLTMAKKEDKKDKRKGHKHKHAAADPVIAAQHATAAALGEKVEARAEEEEDKDEPMCRLIANSWKQCKALNDKKGMGKGYDDIEEDDDEAYGGASGSKKSKGKASSTTTTMESDGGSGGGFFGFGRKKKADTEDKEKAAAASSARGNQNSNGGALVPETFDDMMMFNAKMIGANTAFIELILKDFDTLVGAVVNKDDFRLQSLTRIISLKLYAEKYGKVTFREYKICMLASMRPLLPKLWDANHEKAWEWLWDSIADSLNKSIELPKKYHSKVERLVTDLDLDEKRTIGLNVFKRLFVQVPQTEMLFKQNNERLAFIVRRAMEFSLQIFARPSDTVDELLLLGLKHIMWSIPTEYFEPFLICCVQEVQDKCGSDNLEPFAWALEIVASQLVLTIEDGSNPLLSAVLKNSPKDVRKELGKMPRAQRPCAVVGVTAAELA